MLVELVGWLVPPPQGYYAVDCFKDGGLGLEEGEGLALDEEEGGFANGEAEGGWHEVASEVEEEGEGIVRCE